MNYAMLSGNLGRDPEMRATPQGDTVLSFPMGVQTGSRDKPATMWVQCSIWGKRAASLQPYLYKGQKVTVSGPIKLYEYQAEDGSVKTALRLSVDQLELPPKASQDQGGYQQPAAATPKQTSVPQQSSLADINDDLPF